MSTPMRRSRLEQHEAQRTRINSVVVQDTWAPGRVQVDGVGEFEIELDFGVTFTEKPYLLPAALEIINSAEVEHFPEVSMSISNWKLKNRGNDPATHYAGAVVALRVSGRTEQMVWVNYVFYGKAFTSLGVEGAWDL